MNYFTLLSLSILFSVGTVLSNTNRPSAQDTASELLESMKQLDAFQIKSINSPTIGGSFSKIAYDLKNMQEQGTYDEARIQSNLKDIQSATQHQINDIDDKERAFMAWGLQKKASIYCTERMIELWTEQRDYNERIASGDYVGSVRQQEMESPEFKKCHEKLDALCKEQEKLARKKAACKIVQDRLKPFLNK